MSGKHILKAAVVGVAAYYAVQYVQSTTFYANAGSDGMKSAYAIGTAAVAAGLAMHFVP